MFTVIVADDVRAKPKNEFAVSPEGNVEHVSTSCIPSNEVIVMRSEAWSEGGERKELTPIAKEVEVEARKILLIVIRVLEDPTHKIPLLMFFIFNFLHCFGLCKPSRLILAEECC